MRYRRDKISKDWKGRGDVGQVQATIGQDVTRQTRIGQQKTKKERPGCRRKQCRNRSNDMSLGRRRHNRTSCTRQDRTTHGKSGLVKTASGTTRLPWKRGTRHLDTWHDGTTPSLEHRFGHVLDESQNVSMPLDECSFCILFSGHVFFIFPCCVFSDFDIFLMFSRCNFWYNSSQLRMI